MSQELPFTLDFLQSPSNPWGPSKVIPAALTFNGIPYAPFSKSDKLGKVSDWQSADEQSSKNQKYFRDPYHAYGASSASKFAVEQDYGDADSFEVVDSSVSAAAPSSAASSSSAGIQSRQKTVLRGKLNNTNLRKGNNPGPKINIRKTNVSSSQHSQRRNWVNPNQSQIDDATKRKKVAAEIKANYSKITDIDFHKLTKLNLDLGKNSAGETVCIRANLKLIKSYNKAFDKLSSTSNLQKKSAPLRVYSKEFTSDYVDTMEDDVLKTFANDNTADILITSDILATIMASHKSNFPWDIKITKNLKTGKLYFCEDPENQIETIVDENDKELFSKNFHSEDNTINNYLKLSEEFNTVNANFKKFVSSTASIDAKTVAPGSIPLEKSESVKSGKIYRYKLFKIPENTNQVEEHKKSHKLTLAKQEEEESEIKYLKIAVRTEADLLRKIEGSDNEYEAVAVHALNQYKSSQLDWKTTLLAKRGAIISTELRKNNNLMSKWIINAVLGEVSDIKLGFIGRDSFNSTEKHTVLGVFTHTPLSLASQSNLLIGNGWAIFKSIIDIVNHESSVVEDADSKETVSFVLVKDPVNPKLSLYKID